MVINIILFIISLVAIIKGADYMTDGASAVAHRYGIPSLVIGMTIVAMGSSAPELVVSSVSAVQGKTDISIGNVVGSNIFNILGIIGVTALVSPIAASRGNVRNDVPFVVLSAMALSITALDSLFTPGAKCEIGRSEGLMLLCMFAIFLSYTFAMSKSGSPSSNSDQMKIKPLSMPRAVIYIVLGMSALIYGGDILVDSATNIALDLGISQSIIALTIVSAGTSLPELAASVMAARKGDTAMALGNVVGSNIFNVFFIIGISATITPLALGGITIADIGTLIVASIIFWIFTKTDFSIKRWEGAILIILQITYYIYLVINAKNCH